MLRREDNYILNSTSIGLIPFPARRTHSPRGRWSSLRFGAPGSHQARSVAVSSMRMQKPLRNELSAKRTLDDPDEVHEGGAPGPALGGDGAAGDVGAVSEGSGGV